jgi:hypothetical protein
LLEIEVAVSVNLETVVGIAVIEPNGNEVLIGMEFLRSARKDLLIQPFTNVVCLKGN